MTDYKIKSRQEYEEMLRELAAQIMEHAVPFKDDTPEKQQRRKAKALKDPLGFAKTYFPHYFTEEFADFHIEEAERIIKALKTNLAQVLAEIWFRGSGKTVFLAIALVMWAVHVAGLVKYAIIVGADRDLAKERTAAIRLELQLNSRFRHDWPDAKLKEGEGEDHDFKTPDGARYRAQGYKQAIRGKIHGAHRPRLIIIDDLESHVDKNPKIAEEKLKFILEEAFGAFGKDGGLVLLLGNLTSLTSALSMFVDRCDHEPDNPYIRYRIVRSEENGKPTWPQAYPIAKLRGIEKVMGSIGYGRHFLMKPTADGKVFKEDWLHYHNPWSPNSGFNETNVTSLGGINLPSREALESAPKVVYCDPSLGSRETSDYKAIVTVAFWDGRYWLIEAYCRQTTILDMLRYMYELHQRYPDAPQFMERNFWQRVIWDWIPQVAQEYGFTLPVSGVDNRLAKDERIQKMQPLFEMGHFWICTVGKDWELGKEQLLSFPGGHDDFPDALAGAIERFSEIQNRNRYETIIPGDNSYCDMW